MPGVVTLENIRETRFSRNHVISRVLTECKWVRELNEGVPRIYDDMKGFSLDEPTFSETPGYFKLVLRNNIVERQLLQGKKLETNAGEQGREQLDELERQILAIISSRGAQSRAQLAKALGKADKTVSTHLRHLTELNFLTAIGGRTNPNRVYELKSDS